MGLAPHFGFQALIKPHDDEGYQWIKKPFDSANEVLKDNETPGWSEPDELKTSTRPHLDSFDAKEDDHRFFRENAVFPALWEATRVSLEDHTAIVFS